MISRKLSIELLGGNKLLRNAKEVYIASASVSNYALDLFLRNINPEADLYFLIGIHLPSHSNALESLREGEKEGKWKFKVYTRAFFHPKLYLIHGSGFFKTYIGSGNFTKGGWFGNEELFHVEDSLESYDTYKSWFERRFSEGTFVDKKMLELLKIFHQKKLIQDQEESKEIEVLQDLMNGNFNLDAIDFSNQFFDKEHHEIFSPLNKGRENISEIKEMRKNVRKRLFDLHDLVWPQVQTKGWNIYPHYQTDDIISSMELGFHSSHEISAMWLHYGRDQQELKRYGQDETPLFYSRLQIIIHYYDVGIWLRFGKAGGSRQDREYFHHKMHQKEYRDEFFKLFGKLGSDYWIRIGEEKRKFSDFKTASELHEFTQTDDWRKDYFIIGISIDPGSAVLSETNIAYTILENFEKLYPLYKTMKDPTFE